ncbi:DUF3079 domain-containing protein [Paraburkholderia denitrificans]|uniref:DUF3079 domain-containing protein n=1 Tax=Paraburkholderia denitrificans TaxID=694025 RepID=A0ABW0JCQ0_9BURK
MAKKFPLIPSHPERLCWGCDHYCPAEDMRCGNGQSRTQHPIELLGDDWYLHGDWGIEIPADDNNAEAQGGSEPVLAALCKSD